MTYIQAVNYIKETLTMTVDKNEKADLCSYIPEGTKKIFLYGAGDRGRITYAELSSYGISVTGFIDRNAGKRDFGFPVPVYGLDELGGIDKRNAIVFLSYVTNDYSDTRKMLTDAGFQTILLPVDFFATSAIFFKELQDGVSFAQFTDEILEALALLDDDLSRDVFCGQLRAYVTQRFGENIVCSTSNAFTPEAMPLFPSEWNCMVDCGAYIGDSLESVLKTRQTLDSYIGFEPDSGSFQRLSDYVQAQSGVKEAFLYPCATGNNNMVMHFDNTGTVASNLSEEGGALVPVVSLDNVLQRFVSNKRLLVKMDVEGFEVQTLQGASRVIKQMHPQLMVCVYHHIRDLWEIPLYLHRIEPSYHYALRCYTVVGSEAILYAFCNG